MNLQCLNKNGKLQIPKAPMMCFLDLTECCNLKCWFCYNGSYHNNQMANYYDIIKILDDLHNSGCNEVTYIGGEPTLHPQLFEIMNHADEIGMSQGIITNGQIIDEGFARKLSEYKDIEVGISIHSHDESKQDRIAGREKTFYNITQAIKILEKYSISWYSQTSLIRDNYLEIIELREFLLSIGKPSRMDLSRMVVEDIESDCFLDENGYIEVFKQINSIDTIKLPIRIEAFPRCWLKEIAERYDLDLKKIKFAVRPCYAWTAQISVDVRGNVRLCPTGGKVAGNVLSEGISEIWNGDVIRNFQSFEWLYEECVECKEFVYCGGACKMTCHGCSPTPDIFIRR